MTEILGSAELQTGVDLKGLDVGLARAEARVARSVAVMQGMLDRVSAHAELSSSVLDAAAAKLASTAIPSTGGPAGSSTSSRVIRNSEGQVWGVRGPQRAGSLDNPVATVLLASKFYPTGSRGAAIADSNQSDEQRGDTGLATAADMAALTGAVMDLARNMSPVNGLATAGGQGMTEPGAAERTVVMLDRQNGDALGRAAVAMESIASSARSGTQDTRTLLTAMRSGDTATQRDLLMAFAPSSSSTGPRQGLTGADAAVLAAALRSAAASRGTDVPVMLTSAEASKRLGVAPTRVYYLAGSGDLAGSQKVHGAWQIPADSVAAYMAANSAAGGGGAGGGGGGLLPVALGGGGGGGNNRAGLLSTLLWGGGGALGLAGFGSLASLAGLGPEHLLMTALGLAGSAGTAVAGAGLLGLGSAGVMGAGMAADASSFGQAANDIKSVVQAQNALNQAISVYGKNSANAQAAQAQLNSTLASFSPVARAAVLQAANTAQAFHQAFNTATGPAEAVGATVLNQGMQVGMAFLPTLGQAALTDANLIKQGLQPLFTWLKGPEGIGIFQNLEHEFSQQLPFAVNAGVNGLEALLRIMNLASGYTGGFTKHLDDLFKKLNGMSNLQLEQYIKRLVGDFRVWEQFFKALGTDIFRLFNSDVGTGRSIIVTLTHMLQKLGDWETSVKGRQDLMTIFTVHKNEVQALLQLLPLLLGPLAKLYLTVAPAATSALTDLAKGITAVVKAIESIPGGSWILAIGLMGAKLGLLGRLLTGGGAAAAGDAAATDAAAGGGTAAAAGSAGGLLGLLAKSGLGTAVSSSVETGALGAAGVAEGAGMAGLAEAITSAGIAIAPVAAGLLPLLAAAGGVYGLIKLFGLFSGSNAPTTDYSSTQLTHLLASPHPGVLSMPAIKGAQPTTYFTGAGRFANPTQTHSMTEAAPTLKDIANTKAMRDAFQQWYDIAKSSVNVSKLNVNQLAALSREGDRFAQVFPKDAQLIDKLNAPIKTTLDGLRDVFKILTDRWHTDLTSGLGKIKDDFSANLRLIASQIGLSSHEGEQAWKKSLDNMVKDVTNGMLRNKIAVGAGMDAINQVTEAGVKGQAITWQQKSSLILGAIDSLYRAGKITPQTYYNDLSQLTQTGIRRVGADTTLGLQKANQDAKAQYNQGYLDKQGLDNKLHTQQLTANSQHRRDLEAWVQTLVTQMSAGGSVSVQGANAILTPLNQALKELGQKPVSLVSLSAAVTAATPQLGAGLPTLPGVLGSQVSLPGSGAASGALYQIGAAGHAGRDTVPLNVAGTPVMVGSGEQVAVFNRHQQPIVNMALSMLGYDGMAGLFSDVNTPNYLAGGGTIKTPGARGGGVQGSLLNAAFRMLGKDANKLLHSKAGKGGGISGAGVSPGSWMKIVRQLASRMGWGAGEIAAWQGVENIEDPAYSLTAKNPTSPAYGLAQGITGPGWYYGYGGNPNTEVGQLVAMANYIRGRYGTPSGALAHEHSHGWYASGGLVRGHSQGGFPFGQGGDRFAGMPPGQTDMQRIKSAMATISGLVGTSVGSGGDAGRMQELLSYWPQLWSIYDPNLGQPASAYITTTDALGNSIQPTIDQAAVNTSAGELTKELGWENQYVGDLGHARGLAQTWHPRVETAIAKRRTQIGKLRADEAAKLKRIRDKINANLKLIASYQKQVTRLQNKITAEQGKSKPNHAAIAGWQKQINDLNQKITDLQGDNQTLGGAGTYVGTGGQIGHVQNEYGSQITGLQSEVTTLSGYSSALAAMPSTISGSTGVGGLLGAAKIQQHTLGNELAQLEPAALQAALATANTQYASSNSSTNASANLASLLQQQNLTLAEQLAVSQAQYNVLANMPPYAGVFHDGGVVPGPIGAEMMAKVKAGETIIPIGGSNTAGAGNDGNVHVHLHGALRSLEHLIDVQVEKGTRKMAASAARPRPGQRRGLIAPFR
jgi:hypothetical protein